VIDGVGRGRPAWPVLPLLVLLACGAVAAAGTESVEPMRDEDVVVLFVGGTPASAIIERIRAAENVAFDLSEEMLGELRIAGIPDEIIQAMILRQNELHPPEPEAEPVAPVVETGRLRVALNPGAEEDPDKPRPTLKLATTIDAQMAESLRLRSTDAEITDLAIALICRTATHVPDHWRSQSPLGRDFITAPRHRLLAFIPGATTRDGSLVLEVPAEIDVVIEPGEAHDLTLAIAVQAEDRYFLIASDGLDDVVLDDSGLALEAELNGDGTMRGLTARFHP
jgi:hypothetical protein